MTDDRPVLPVGVTNVVRFISYGLAVLGGVALLFITLTTDASIVGRALIPIGLRPIQGDFEIVEMGTAFALFSFMPWCQFNRGHATVDVFTSRLPLRVLNLIELIIDLVFALIITIIVWRMSVGLGDKFGNGQKTFILQMPVWWTYAVGMIGGVAWIAVSYFCLAESLAAVITGRPRRRATESADL